VEKVAAEHTGFFIMELHTTIEGFNAGKVC